VVTTRRPGDRLVRSFRSTMPFSSICMAPRAVTETGTAWELSSRRRAVTTISSRVRTAVPVSICTAPCAQTWVAVAIPRAERPSDERPLCDIYFSTLRCWIAGYAHPACREGPAQSYTVGRYIAFSHILQFCYGQNPGIVQQKATFLTVNVTL